MAEQLGCKSEVVITLDFSDAAEERGVSTLESFLLFNTMFSIASG